jgi:hypothetical protein
MSFDQGTKIALAAGLLITAACRGDATKPAPAAATPSGSGERQALVNCQGANACRAKSLCETAHNACAGMNACKGQGWIDVSPADCAAAGGKVVHVTR